MPKREVASCTSAPMIRAPSISSRLTGAVVRILPRVADQTSNPGRDPDRDMVADVPWIRRTGDCCGCLSGIAAADSALRGPSEPKGACARSTAVRGASRDATSVEGMENHAQRPPPPPQTKARKQPRSIVCGRQHKTYFALRHSRRSPDCPSQSGQGVVQSLRQTTLPRWCQGSTAYRGGRDDRVSHEGEFLNTLAHRQGPTDYLWPVAHRLIARQRSRRWPEPARVVCEVIDVGRH